ncbi:MAG TPA: hypothetical protein VK118_07280 [Tetragenococcus sp.]|nr:hypothetical protein [Tetragenococcus sp.]
MTTVSYDQLKKEMTQALDTHIDILKDVNTLDTQHLDAIMFMMRSFGFIFDRAPKVLYEEDHEEMNFLMFQYYSLLNELKFNLALNYPAAAIQDRLLTDIVANFPTTYETELKQWWEELTGLHVDNRKQTMDRKKTN